MKRRGILGGISVLFAGGSGCTDFLDREQNTLGEITVGNRDTKPHVVILAVEHDSSVIHMSHHELSSFDEDTRVADSDSIPGNWPQESAETVIYAQVDDRSVQKQQLSDLPRYGCYEITVLVDEKGRINILHSKGCTDE